MRTAYVVSTFDMVNVADLDLLEQVRRAADEVVVLVLGDREAARLHGRAPVVPEGERLGLVDALRETAEVRLLRSVDELPARREDVAIYTDEPALREVADVLLAPWRRSSSLQLRAALGNVTSQEAC